jgi:hypothetical protein
VTALAMAGRATDAVAAADGLLRRHPMNLSLLFEPSFAQARATPQFAALATQLGLIDYWRTPGHAPDFCVAADAPAMCAGLSKVHSITSAGNPG